MFETWSPLGTDSICKINSRGLRLLELCSELNLAITNTCRQKEKYNVTWIHPRSKHNHLIDFIITRKRDIGDACNVKVLCSADCDIDHKLVRGKFKLRIRKKIRMNGVKVPKQLNISRLAEKDVCNQLCLRLSSVNLQKSWEAFKEQMYSVGAEVLGFVDRKHNGWFNENDTGENYSGRKIVSTTLC